MDDDMGFFNNGVAQGGLVETNDGCWYSMLMQDRGAAGRFPVLVPVSWQDDRPVFGKDGKIPSIVENVENRPYYQYEPLYCSDRFDYITDADGHCRLKKQWQWNHEPNPAFWKIVNDGGLKIVTGKICTNVTQAVNTLTQRMLFPKSTAEVTIDASDLNEGDYAGICALQGCYSMLAITRELRRYYLVVIKREATEKNRNTTIPDYMPGMITEKVSLGISSVRLKMEADFEKGADMVSFFYREPREGGKWRKIGGSHKLYFGLDHFAGCRCGLAVYATKKTGGSAIFQDFQYRYEE